MGGANNDIIIDRYVHIHRYIHNSNSCTVTARDLLQAIALQFESHWAHLPCGCKRSGLNQASVNRWIDILIFVSLALSFVQGKERQIEIVRER